VEVMTRKEMVLKYLQSIYPDDATNSDIVLATGIEPHPQVFQKTADLRKEGKIAGRQVGKVWHFQAIPGKKLSNLESHETLTKSPNEISPKEFEDFARKIFSGYFETQLIKTNIPDIDKNWDFLSEDGSVVGDAKYYTLVQRKKKPPAKFSIIAEHVWLLEKTKAEKKFLVFGNQIEVPRLWLEKYGNLVKDVQFYFLDNHGEITRLK